MVVDLEELEKMDASEIHAKRLNAKEVITLQNGETFIFTVAGGTAKFTGGDQDLRTSTLIRDHPIRGEEHEDFLGESERSPPQPQDALLDLPVKHEMISGPFLETSSTAITLNRESSSTRRENNNFLYHCFKLTSPGLLIQPWM